MPVICHEKAQVDVLVAIHHVQERAGRHLRQPFDAALAGERVLDADLDDAAAAVAGDLELPVLAVRLPGRGVVVDERGVLAERVELADDRVDVAVRGPVQRADADRVLARAGVGEHPHGAEVGHRVRVGEVTPRGCAARRASGAPAAVTGQRRPSSSVPSSRKQAPSMLSGWSSGAPARPTLALLGAALDRAHRPAARAPAARARAAPRPTRAARSLIARCSPKRLRAISIGGSEPSTAAARSPVRTRAIHARLASSGPSLEPKCEPSTYRCSPQKSHASASSVRPA